MARAPRVPAAAGCAGNAPCGCCAHALTQEEEEEEDRLFKADAVNEEDSERDRATQV